MPNQIKIINYIRTMKNRRKHIVNVMIVWKRKIVVR
jgi:hypothetical protein